MSLRSRLFLLLLVCCLANMQAQSCFDMTALTESVRFMDRDLALQSTEIRTDEFGKKHYHYTYGWKEKLSPDSHPRQTLITTAGTDDLCPSLSVLPPDESTSVRLASDGYLLPTDSAKGEMLFFDYTVPATAPRVVIKHAAVLENPQHPIAGEYPNHSAPWCRIVVVIKDSVYERFTIEHNPNRPASVKDFTAFTNTQGRDALWLDWTTDTLDFSEFIGMPVTIRLDNRDCALTSWKTSETGKVFNFCTDHHTGHLYAHLSCVPMPQPEEPEEPDPVCTYEGTFSAPDTLCADAANWQISNKFTAGAVVTYDLRFDELAQVQGMQNIIGGTLESETADIVVPLPKADSTSYLRPSVYNAELTLHTICETDTVISLSFTVLYPSFVLFQRWNDVIAVSNSTYNGGYDITAVSWFRDGAPVQGRGSHNAWYEETGGFSYSATDTSSVAYHAALTRADDGQTFCTCKFRPVRQNGNTSMNEAPAEFITGGGPRSVRIVAHAEGTWTLCTLSGTLLASGTLGQAEEVLLSPMQDVPLLLVFRTADGATRRLMLN